MPFSAYIIVILKATVISKLCIIIGKTFDLAVSQEFVVTFFSKPFLDSECHIHYGKDSGRSKHNEKKKGQKSLKIHKVFKQFFYELGDTKSVNVTQPR